MSDPWSEISASSASGSDNLRRATAEHPLDFWWGRDHQDRFLLVLDVEPPRTRPRFPDLAGVEIMSSRLGNGTERLVLTLLEREDRGIFQALCNDLLAATAHLERGASREGLGIVVSRLARWQDLFRRRRDKLSLWEIIGLIGELLFLRDCLLKRVPVASALAMWRGPYGDEQDFVVGGTIIEVKTQLATSDHALLISSEHQLDTATTQVAIVHQVLGLAPAESSEATSLNRIVAELRAHLSTENTAALDALDAGLEALGYVAIEAYDEPVWLMLSREVFVVGEGFPRLIPSVLPVGVDHVRYNVRLEVCAPFRIAADAFLESLLGG